MPAECIEWAFPLKKMEKQNQRNYHSNFCEFGSHLLEVYPIIRLTVQAKGDDDDDDDDGGYSGVSIFILNYLVEYSNGWKLINLT